MNNKINTAIESLKKATEKFSKIFPDWEPHPKDPNLENMIRLLLNRSFRDKYSQELLEELIKISTLFNPETFSNFSRDN